MLSNDDLRFFLVITNSSSLAAASRELNVTPPTVTQRLQAIENKLKVKLVNRHPRAIMLTDEGKLLSEGAKTVLEQLNALEENILNCKNDVRGKLKILAPFGFGSEYIAPIASKFKWKYPGLEIDLMLSDKPAQKTARKSWDIIIHIGELSDTSMKLAVLAPNRRILCASPKYFKTHGKPTCPSDIRNHDCIVLKENLEDVTMWRFRSKQNDNVESIRITPHLISNTAQVVKQWALEGHGLIVRSEWDVIQEINKGLLETALEDYNLPNADIVALLNSDQTTRCARTMKFLQFLRNELTPIPWA
ncbi:LysR family transcriptional regulator [Spartinivicinus poritis]|uniref:LysR family transcriptional regulator n=1 Tax=Spartinivicinus poritis TaxID=2994640 RepID=A0ABT5U7Q1_9GAMM|nr:LysR family transcriptional regulator [Spartinivicinus sp. A2-2]MDE1462399.1 LysR family transcriptional regulator [Spartinivicinus sp. A2-2]